MIENRNARRPMALSASLVIICTLFSHFSTLDAGPCWAAAQFEKHLEVGKSYLVRQDFDMAIREFNTALKLAPNNSKVLLERGTAYNALNKFDAAIADFSSTIAAEPTSYLAYNNRGVAYWRKNDLPKALSDFDRAIAVDPKPAIAYLNRAGASLSWRNVKQMQLSAGKASAWLAAGNWRNKFATHAAMLAILCHKSANQPAEAKRLTAETLAKADHLSWPYDVLSYFSGKMTLEKLMEEAEKSDYNLTQTQCFLGLDRLLQKDTKAANDRFSWVVRYGVHNSVEYSIAKTISGAK